MVAMAVMVASFRGSVEDWRTPVLPSALYLRVEGGGVGLDPAAQARLAAVPGVAHIGFGRTAMLRLAPDRPPVALTAFPIDPLRPARVLPLLGATRAVPPGETPVWLSEPMARLYRRHVGEHLVLPLAGKPMPVFVAGIWRDYPRQFGA